MSLYKKDIAKTIIVISLVAVFSIGSYLLFPDALPKMMYATGAAIRDDALATEDFIAEILKSGGVCSKIALNPWICLMFENGTEYYFWMVCGGNYTWMIIPKIPNSTGFNLKDWPPRTNSGKQLEINASGLQGFDISWGEGWVFADSITKPNSSKFGRSYGTPWSVISEQVTAEGVNENIQTAGNFSWHGNYNRGSEINTILHVDGTTTDLGTHYENNYLIDFNLDVAQRPLAYSRVHAEINSSKSKLVFWDTGSWETRGQSILLPDGTSLYRPYGCWSMQVAQLSQMAGRFESASICFEGKIWLDGNYTVAENGNARNETMNSAANVYFGTVYVTSENGTISTLTFDFNQIEILMFAHAQE